MDELNRPDDRGGPYEILRIAFFTIVTKKAWLIRNVRSWKKKKDYLKSVFKLAKLIDANDTYMHGHCDKVMKYSMMISSRLGLSSMEIKIIKTASILHDVGKVGIDINILRKKDKLTEEDWVKIKMHPEIGATIVRESGLLDEVVPIVMHHHARYAGGGYPDPDRRDGAIPIGSRIIAVADSFDAMTSDRPYRKALSREEAMDELRKCSGSQFDPNVVSAFLKA